MPIQNLLPSFFYISRITFLFIAFFPVIFSNLFPFFSTGTSHFLGLNFARAFDVFFQTETGDYNIKNLHSSFLEFMLLKSFLELFDIFLILPASFSSSFSSSSAPHFFFSYSTFCLFHSPTTSLKPSFLLFISLSLYLFLFLSLTLYLIFLFLSFSIYLYLFLFLLLSQFLPYFASFLFSFFSFRISRACLGNFLGCEHPVDRGNGDESQ